MSFSLQGMAHCNTSGELAGNLRRSMMDSGTPSERVDGARVAALDEEVLKVGPYEAVQLLDVEEDAMIARVLARQNPAVADEILWAFAEERRSRILAAASA